MEEKNKTGPIRESRVENVPESLNLQAISMKFSAATLSQREVAPQGLLSAYAGVGRTDLSKADLLPSQQQSCLLVDSCLCNNMVSINKLQIQ